MVKCGQCAHFSGARGEREARKRYKLTHWSFFKKTLYAREFAMVDAAAARRAGVRVVGGS